MRTVVDGRPANVGRYWTGFAWVYAGEFTDDHGQPVRCHVESAPGGQLGYPVRVGRTPAEVIEALRLMPVHLRPPLPQSQPA